MVGIRSDYPAWKFVMVRKPLAIGTHFSCPFGAPGSSYLTEWKDDEQEQLMIESGVLSNRRWQRNAGAAASSRRQENCSATIHFIFNNMHR